ncbi:GntR family transcriptional regulator [Roseisalinus antarcticus]|uniref:HTH-type transcriptional repressor YvoA n=1 Tax=Roseisalinus antarcticus TaxID=254357 RepID=A0A1Y5SWC6_9RHOB|nr:GntR family transcriptional regulator [Roseisalinus antarcticus]SLN50187.1 HTH-type transcriptional repressor YvoA [Roseisalinus antarcticus]
MDGSEKTGFFAPEHWFRKGQGPRYRQLHRYLAKAIRDGRLEEGTQLPPERELADLADVSRVTVRRAVAQLASDGMIDQRRGSGSFVRRGGPRLEQSLSTLISFTELMQARGMTPSSQVLGRGLFMPTPDETTVLGLSSGDQVARVERLRTTDGTPIALERSSLPVDILPDPDLVETSLYAILRSSGSAPNRAIQRVTAVNLTPREAKMLALPEATAVLQIDRTAYLASGRPIEFTRGVYRSDIYDFVTEVRLEGP